VKNLSTFSCGVVLPLFLKHYIFFFLLKEYARRRAHIHSSSEYLVIRTFCTNALDLRYECDVFTSAREEQDAWLLLTATSLARPAATAL
jgi:hypothetical protein